MMRTPQTKYRGPVRLHPARIGLARIGLARIGLAGIGPARPAGYCMAETGVRSHIQDDRKSS
jgi:hypothetical protein